MRQLSNPHPPNRTRQRHLDLFKKKNPAAGPRENWDLRRLALLQAFAPGVDLLLGLVLGVAVLRLYFTFELLTVAVDLGELVVSELTPLLLDLARELLPVPFDGTPSSLMRPSWLRHRNPYIYWIGLSPHPTVNFPFFADFFRRVAWRLGIVFRPACLGIMLAKLGDVDGALLV
jgi:hypothetical protein